MIGLCPKYSSKVLNFSLISGGKVPDINASFSASALVKYPSSVRCSIRVSQQLLDTIYV